MKRLGLRYVAMLLVCLGVLSGCATGYRLDNHVQAFSSLPTLPANPSYRFERLPSQQQMLAQAHIEALADPALHRAGLRRDDAAPNYSVQVSARIQRVISPWADPWDWGWGGGLMYGPGFGYLSPFPRMQQAWFHREVAVIVREIASGRVVFESRAFNDGPWLGSDVALQAMFDAALQGFPNAPPGPRRVDITLGAR
jgi:hypothetical protein